MALGLFYITGAQAVHDLSTGMQLDGNVATTCPAGLGTCTSSQTDWAAFYDVNGGTTTPKTTLPNTDFKTATFSRDFESGGRNNCSLTSTSTTFCTGDSTTFATGSKDTLDITGGGWQCNRDNNVNSKIDIMNAYAASYVIPAGQTNAGDKVMYFALEKNKDNGTNDVGFWFLQGSNTCSAPSGHQDFQGQAHTLGDVLIVSEFSSGGGVSNITAYKWVGGANPLQQIAAASGNGGDCKTNLGGDNLCATTNSGSPFNTNLDTPWLSADATLGVGTNVIVPPDFFEGGINITKAFAGSGGGTAPSCFNTFVGDTRSSTALTATLFDFALGQLGECKTTLTTKAGDTANGGTASPSSIGTGSVSSGSDTATLSITGTSSWGGTLTWWLCGPVSSDACDQTKGLQVTSRTVSNSSTADQFVSETATLTAAGRYCWSAHFEPNTASKNAGVTSDDDDGVNECFTVAKVTPTLATCSGTYSGTTCTPGSAVDLGNPVSDRALVSGLATEPGSGGTSTTYPTINPTTPGAYAGTITFTLKGPAATGCGITATGTGTNPQSVNVDTLVGNKVYGPVTFTPDNAGRFSWQAQLANASSVNNILPVTHNANCDDANEDVVVNQVPTVTTTRQWVLPQDKVSIDTNPTGGNLQGNVTFKLFDTSANCTANGDTVGQGGLLYKSSAIAISGNGPKTASTNNQTSAPITAGTTVYWRVTYVSTTQAQTGSSSVCTEQTTVSFAGNDSGITVP
jgi:hypothetical protein